MEKRERDGQERMEEPWMRVRTHAHSHAQGRRVAVAAKSARARAHAQGRGAWEMPREARKNARACAGMRGEGDAAEKAA